MDPYRFELAQERDAPLITAASCRLIEAGLPPSWPVERVLAHVRRADSIVLVARFEAMLAGFAIMQFGEDHAHLNLLGVDSAHQRNGLGRALLNWLEDSARVAGIFRVGLELRAGNSGAHRFYAALGYRDCGRIGGYYQGIEDALRMRHDLRIAATPPVSEW